MDVTCEALYTLYGECFPCYPLSREWFFSLLALEQGDPEHHFCIVDPERALHQIRTSAACTFPLETHQ